MLLWHAVGFGMHFCILPAPPNSGAGPSSSQQSHQPHPRAAFGKVRSHTNPSPSRCEADFGFWECRAGSAGICRIIHPWEHPAAVSCCTPSLSSCCEVCAQESLNFSYRGKGRFFSDQGEVAGSVFLPNKCTSLNTRLLSAASFYTGKNHPGKNSGRGFQNEEAKMHKGNEFGHLSSYSHPESTEKAGADKIQHQGFMVIFLELI